MGNGVKAINVSQSKVSSVTLENEEELTTEAVLSSMGYVETLNCCEPKLTESGRSEIGQVSLWAREESTKIIAGEKNSAQQWGF